MGHRHLPELPRSKRWTHIVERLAGYDEPSEVAAIARETADAARVGFDRLAADPSLVAVFHFLASVAAAAGTERPAATLAEAGIQVSEDLSPLSLVRALRAAVPEAASPEQAALVERAASQTIGEWQRFAPRDVEQGRLFDEAPDPLAPWRQASSGSGFCEISRIFFSRLTERQLSYYLDRAASRQIGELAARESFDGALSTHISDLSRHAFETAKITQSYAAGWFENNAGGGKMPSRSAARRFVAKAVGKLREEIRREALR